MCPHRAGLWPVSFSASYAAAPRHRTSDGHMVVVTFSSQDPIPRPRASARPPVTLSRNHCRFIYLCISIEGVAWRLAAARSPVCPSSRRPHGLLPSRGHTRARARTDTVTFSLGMTQVVVIGYAVNATRKKKPPVSSSRPLIRPVSPADRRLLPPPVLGGGGGAEGRGASPSTHRLTRVQTGSDVSTRQ